MSDIIHLLPDSVANQIAAGEVIQRPASVVKELMENSVDAGASTITVHVKDAGKTMVQVIDNGTGMSETDARMSFERHATSKIAEANDLFAIRTMGFRGEALASIAAVAEVSVKTRLVHEQLGTGLRVSGSKILEQEALSCPKGTNFQVKNLFFNVPARRKFLKSDQTEFRHIISEFNHVALTHTNIEFILIHNNTEIYHLPQGNLRQRIIGIFGKSANTYLIPLETETTIIKISGFIGKPEYARKTFGEQFFFVNNRYMRHPYFHKALMKAYEEILAPDHIPSYFVFFETNPDKIDINIHPTKTEIKFEDEQAIWQILSAAVKEAIGRHNLSPSLDFSKEGIIDIPIAGKDTEIKNPAIDINPEYNPFSEEQTYARKPVDGWEKLYGDERGGRTRKQQDMQSGQDMQPDLNFDMQENKETSSAGKYLQILNRYILTSVKSGLMIIDQRRASERILYDSILRSLESNTRITQQSLFPETIELSAQDYQVYEEIAESINSLGFDIRTLGSGTIIIHGTPSYLISSNIKASIESMLEQYKNLQSDINLDIISKLARSAASASAIQYGKRMNEQEMREMVDQLFACGNPNYSPSGEIIVKIVDQEGIEQLFKGTEL